MVQSLSRILFHIIFSTKNRHLLIKAEIEEELFKYISAIFRANESPLLSLNGTENHIHILSTLSRKIALSKLIEEVKKDFSK